MVECNMRIHNTGEITDDIARGLARCRVDLPVCFACFAFKNVTMADQLYGIPASRAAIAPATIITTGEIRADQIAHILQSDLNSRVASLLEGSRSEWDLSKNCLYQLHVPLKRRGIKGRTAHVKPLDRQHSDQCDRKVLQHQQMKISTSYIAVKLLTERKNTTIL